jgi:hypothetical protein
MLVAVRFKELWLNFKEPLHVWRINHFLYLSGKEAVDDVYAIWRLLLSRLRNVYICSAHPVAEELPSTIDPLCLILILQPG